MVVHKSFCQIRVGSDLTEDTWFDVVLLKPSEARQIFVPTKGLFVAYKALWPWKPSTGTFDLIFKEKQLHRALIALPLNLRQSIDIHQPVRFEFKKIKRSLFIKNYQQYINND